MCYNVIECIIIYVPVFCKYIHIYIYIYASNWKYMGPAVGPISRYLDGLILLAE